MAVQHTEKDYSGYTSEDFLQDDFFISSVVSPKTESSEFWDALQKEGRINRKEFDTAKELLLDSVKENNNAVTDKDISSLWEDIQTTNQKNRKKKRSIFRKRLYIGTGIAAGIAALFMGIPFFSEEHQSQQEQEDDLMQFVQKSTTQIDNLADIQLVLSEEKIVQVKDKESDIIYDSTEIKISTNDEVLQKEPVAVYNQLAVPKGKRSTLKLSDGTHLYVNAGTVVSYPSEFTGDKREIYVDGEIFINVSHDARRPFIVRTSEVDVQVLGTQFNVMAYSADANKQVVLSSGSVKILSRNNEKDLILKPSEMYQYKNGNSEISKVDLIKYTAWVEGLYYFESERLDAVMLRLSRYYGRSITFDEKIASLRCSGKMDLKDNLTDILNGLSFSFPIKTEQNDGKYHITRDNL